jgi:hypothetical protein
MGHLNNIAPVSAIGRFTGNDRSANDSGHRRIQKHGVLAGRFACPQEHAQQKQSDRKSNDAPGIRGMSQQESGHAKNAHQQCSFEKTGRLSEGKPRE